MPTDIRTALIVGGSRGVGREDDRTPCVSCGGGPVAT